MASVNSTWYYVAPWYYKLQPKLDGWLKSKALKALAPERSAFFGQRPGRRPSGSLSPAAEENKVFAFRNKAMHETIRQSRF